MCGGIVLEEALDLSFDRLLLMLMLHKAVIYSNYTTSSFTILVNNELEIISKEGYLGYFKLRRFQIMTLRICL